MAAKERNGARAGPAKRESQRFGSVIGSAVSAAINRGFVVGREVLVGSIPGIVVGYNIGSFGQFVGNAYPLVVRTALGVTKCGMDEVNLV
jgi:hypothetical protein